jgi:hypothetical protein
MVASLHADHARRMINELPGGLPDGDLQPAPALSLTPGGRVRELRVVPAPSNDPAAERPA